MSTILIVDDAAMVREPIEVALRSRGYDTQTAANGVEALRLIMSKKPDLVLLDMMMSVMDGISLLEQLRHDERTKRLPVLVMTGASDRKLVVAAAKHNVAGYMLKGNFALEAFYEQVRKAIGAAGEAAVVSESEVAAAAPVGVSTSTEIKPAPVETSATPSAPATIVIPEDLSDPVELLKNLKPLLTRTEIAERIAAFEQLRAFSPSVTQLLRLTQSQETSLDRIVKVVSQDQAIALKILRLANSSIYTRGEPVDSVRTAVVRIGMENIRQAILNLGVVESFNKDKAGAVLDLAYFWEHAVGTGLIASELVHAVGGLAPDAAFTMGLLHDVGRVLYVEQLGDVYRAVLAAAEQLQLPLEQVETRMLLVNHADVMDRVLRGWKFPKNLVDPIVFHHLSAGNIRNVATSQVREVMILALANRLAHGLLLGSSGNNVIYPTEELCAGLRLDEAVVRRLADGIPEQASDMRTTMMSASSGSGGWTNMRDAVRGKIGSGFRPLFMSPANGHDAYRLFFESVADQAEEKPTVGVVHYPAPRDRTLVTTRYLKAEEEAGCGELPLVVISSTLKNPVEFPLSKRTNVQVVLRPTPIARLVGAVREALGAAHAKAA